MTVATKGRQTNVGRPTPAPAKFLERGVALDRDNKPIRRVRTSSSDPYFIPDAIRAKLAEEGFEYQWNVWSVLEKENRSERARMYNAGWRPVPADRHDGVFLPPGSKGDIVIGGLILEERPVELSNEARLEDKIAADEQVNGSRRQFGFAPTAPGFEGADKSNSPHVRNNTFVRTSMVHVDDAPRPKYEVSLDD